MQFWWVSLGEAVRYHLRREAVKKSTGVNEDGIRNFLSRGGFHA
ncbi:MAG: hypothetical protein OJF51_004819 [Nitrospira sp.]|nr:MAG: hypothetical protein OJF51_004819 [Nitrospira sp.]